MATCKDCDRRIVCRYYTQWVNVEQVETDKCQYFKNKSDVVSVVKIKDCKYSIINGILRKAINTYGERNQEEMAIEEMAELIQAISHKHRGREHNIAEEIADVEIMLEQLKMINNCSDEVETICNQKIKRLTERLS